MVVAVGKMALWKGDFDEMLVAVEGKRVVENHYTSHPPEKVTDYLLSVVVHNLCLDSHVSLTPVEGKALELGYGWCDDTSGVFAGTFGMYAVP